MENKLSLLRDGIPVEIAILLLVVTAATLTVVVAAVRKQGSGGERILRIAGILLCVLGLGIAGYVAYTAVVLKELPQCVGGSGGCAVVENSEYSKLFGIHLSIYGLLGYLGILGAMIWDGDKARLLAFVLTIFGFGFSLYLKYLELWEIEAICQWCVGSALLMALLFIVSTVRLVSFYGLDDYPGPQDGAGERPAGPPV